MKEEEKCRGVADRIFYLSIPPSIFTTVAACASQAASSKCVEGFVAVSEAKAGVPGTDVSLQCRRSSPPALSCYAVRAHATRTPPIKPGC